MSQGDPVFLYVEDDIKSRMVVKIMMEHVLGYSQLTVFEDSKDFQSRIAELPMKPDVIFLDIQIGPHDGFEMLRMLRDNPDYRDATVIAMTANVMSHDVDKLKKFGFDGLIGKPLMKDIFAELVQKILLGESIWYVP